MPAFPHGDITYKVLAAAFEVHNVLGPGFLESVYEEALVKELERQELHHVRQIDIPIYYKSALVGAHRLDLVVADRVVVELKAVKELADTHTAIALSYLKATDLSVALLLNFSKSSLEYKRVANTKTSKRRVD